MGGYRKTALVIVLFSFLLSSVALGKEASTKDRSEMSVEVATYLHDPYHDGSDHPNAFGGSTKIEIGAVDVEEGHFKLSGYDVGYRYALADWRSADGKRWGQVAFRYECDHWNIGPIAVGRRMTVADLIAMTRENKNEATKLIADLQPLEERHIAFMPPSQPANGC